METTTKTRNPLNLPAKFGYFIMASREPHEKFPLGVIDAEGNYKFDGAFADATCPEPLAVYPTIDAAERAIKRAAGDTDPIIFDGLKVKSLRHTNNGTALDCAAYGFVTYPDGKPACTDFKQMAQA